MDDKYISRIEEIMEERRKANPLNQEMNRLFEEMFPTDKFNSVFKLGSAHAIATFKNDLYKYFCKDCKDYIDLLIKSYKEDKEMCEMLNKLIK